MARFILDVNEERGVTVVLIEHDMGIVMDISERVAVLDFETVAEGSPDQIGADPEVIRAYLGEDEGHREEALELKLRAPRPARHDTRLHAPQLILANARSQASGPRCAARAMMRVVWRADLGGVRHPGSRSRARAQGLGLQRGDGVCIVGDNRPQWVIAELAAQAVGAATAGLYQDSLGAEMAYVIDHSAPAS